MANGMKIIMVEDSEDDAHFICEEIERVGYQLTATRVDSEDALRTALLQADWDLVLSDHSMPGFSAPAALRVLHESGLDIPFIIVSGAISEELAVSLMRAGAHDFVMKDQIGRLVPAIERELREAHTRRQYQRAIDEQQQLSRRIEEEHAQLEQKIIEVGALNRLFKQQMTEMDQTETEHQVLLKRLGRLILDSVDDRHRDGRFPQSLPPLQEGPVNPQIGGSEDNPA